MQKELPIPYNQEEILGDPDALAQMPKSSEAYHSFGVCRVCGTLKRLGTSTDMKEGDEGKTLVQSIQWLPIDMGQCQVCEEINCRYPSMQYYVERVALHQQRIMLAIQAGAK